MADLGELTPYEQVVVDAARSGAEVDSAVGEVRAELIRQLLLGVHGDLDPRGVRVVGATVVGMLDLDYVTARTRLVLRDCLIAGGISCRHARLGEIDLGDSRLAGLRAEGLHTDGNLFLRDIVIDTRGLAGAVNLIDAHIGGQLLLERATITNATGPAVQAFAMRVDSTAVLTGARLTGAGQVGAVRMRAARIGGELGLDDASVTNSSGPAVDLEASHVGGHVFLRKATMMGSGEAAAVRMMAATLGGGLELNNSTVTNSSGPALHLERMHCSGDVFLREARVTGSGGLGAVRMMAATIGISLVLDRLTATNHGGPALHFDSLRVGNNLFLRQAAVTGSGELGAARMLDAQVGGALNLVGATIRNESGPALSADRIRTGNNLYFTDVTAVGHGVLGAIRLHDAHITGEFNSSGLQVTNDDGTAVNGDRLHVGGHLSLRGANLTGRGERAALWLLGATIGGQVDMHGLRIENGRGPLVLFLEAQVKGTLGLPLAVVCPSEEDGRRSCPNAGRQLDVREFVFATLGLMSWRQWLHVLVHHTGSYSPQPYQQLAAVERLAGHDSNARQVLIAQQEDLRRRAPEALGGRFARWRHWLWGWLGNYGYRAHRLVTVLVAVLALAGAAGYVAGQVSTRPGHLAAERVLPANAGVPCSTAELIGLGIDRGLPLGATGLRARCDLATDTRWGQLFTYVLWVLQALVWGLATLAVAAYTGLVRKPT
ncbi:hypothetical protein JOD54_001219 [Actinokineospora baliensis]|uniref:hypothetical protein n=1 Tax=Actinokineospora baliensis TaxID=547056 RepID=UPI00195DD98B|nr:hypothetical protein [Actinokineospora baliensis]MBM7771015.1 hypothetical protein [Actinokineospora baliensis]